MDPRLQKISPEDLLTDRGIAVPVTEAGDLLRKPCPYWMTIELLFGRTMTLQWKRLTKQLRENSKDEKFLDLIHLSENLVAKILSIALIIVIFVSIVDLAVILTKDLLKEPVGFFDKTLIDIFGLFLNVLIALELLENIVAYLRKHIFQVELVIVTSLIAIARKIIIFDFAKYQSLDLIALALAIFALAVSYWLIRRTNQS